MAAHNATHASRKARPDEAGEAEKRDGIREREMRIEQAHLDRVYRRLEEKIHEA
ncbi:MAG: hypothetical protein HOY76_43520, partial [Streptomyces sp.]|nr:hypothetical protein [Streptomyces sp.]